MEREKLIIFLLGAYCQVTNDNFSAEVMVDQTLLMYNQSPMTPDEKEMLSDLGDEGWGLLKSAEFSRKDIRNVTNFGDDKPW